MKNESKAFKVGKLQKVEKWCFHLIDVGFLILSPLLSLLLTFADTKQHCLVFIRVSWKNKQFGGVYVCGTFIKWTNTKWSWKGVQFNAHVSSPGLPRRLFKILMPGTIMFSSGRLCGFLHALLSGDPICYSRALQAAKNGVHRPGRCTTKPADRSCPRHCSPCCVTGLAMHSRREMWSTQRETTAWSQQPVCWCWGLGRAGRGRFPEEKWSWTGKGGKVKWEREAGKDGCSKENCAGGWRKQPTSTNWQPSQNCIKSSRSSWRLPVLMAL